jgi:hypothetical protein
MNWIKNPGRVVGLIYLLLVIGGPLRLMYIPETLFVHGDATATANSIAAHETLFRLGMVSEVFCAVVLIFLTLAFFRLFQEVDKHLATLVVILGGAMPATINFFNTVNDGAALLLIRGADFLSVFDKPQRDALAMLFLRLHYQEILAAETLWGLWLLPLGLLVYKSRMLPRFIGVWLILNCFAYVATSFVGLMLPQYLDVVEKVTFPVLFGELALVLWLLVMGTKQRAVAALAS